MNYRLPTIVEEAEMPTSLILSSPEGETYRVCIEPLPDKDVYSVAVSDPYGATNVEGWLDDVGVHKTLKWWSDLIAQGGQRLRWLFEVDEDD